ncbi:phosphoglycerate mutase family protein [Anaeramoeba ignava]|uniref:phosphoglycerate mutase (2,3-diphosphoglycerate-dependent) n=1 Tax=Anaeramoeba ignava TaxID=1746090 RepID=A0A9Q0LFI9_ANAIG|nr:phosphoglycerate mutase family protein [Anaeramoeba ignava]
MIKLIFNEKRVENTIKTFFQNFNLNNLGFNFSISSNKQELPFKKETTKKLPIDLVFVRHGESEGNFYFRHSKEKFPDEFLKRPVSLWRLTERGKEQAKIAGKWIRENISPYFDRAFTSEYLRAMETAAYLDLPDARWNTATYLRERDWGQFEGLTSEERWKKFKHQMQRRERDSFFFAPPSGESIATVCLRLDRILSILKEECSEKKVIIVSHGEIISTFMVLIEQISQIRFRELSLENAKKGNRIHNCQVIHYSRRNPKTGSIASSVKWMRSVNPWDLEKSDLSWKELSPPFYTNSKLLSEVEKFPILIDTKKYQKKEKEEPGEIELSEDDFPDPFMPTH